MGRWALTAGERASDPKRVRGRIVLVEDSTRLAAGLRSHLEMEGYEVREAHDGKGALDAVAKATPDLVVLDPVLPDMDGLELLPRFRDGGYRNPVLVLSARSEQADKLIAFRSGADDFLTKPFDLLELLVRVQRLVLRDSGSLKPLSPARFGSVTLHEGTRTVLRDGKEVPLSLKEFDLAVALIRRAGEAVSRAELLREVWGHKAHVRTRTVDTHVFHLRRKLEGEPSAPKHFQSVYKFGYRFEY